MENLVEELAEIFNEISDMIQELKAEFNIERKGE